jgi:excisionase family DNA binding protein
MKQEEEEYFTLPKLAEYLAMSKSSIRRLVYWKKIPVTRIGRLLRFKKSSIYEWLESSTEQPMDL